MNKRDSHLTIKPLNEDDEVTLSGGMVLDGDWEEGEGGVRTTTFQGSSICDVGRERPFNGNPVKRCLTGRSNGNGNGR